MKRYIRFNDIILINEYTELFYTVCLVNHDGEIVKPTKTVNY